MKTKHTEGPWFATESGDVYKGMDLMASIYGGSHSQEIRANAALVAAAPEMFEALIEISKGEGAYDVSPIEHAGNCIESMKAIALEAIQKATL